MFYEITYLYEGKKATITVNSVEGWDELFFGECLARIDFLTLSGATIISTCLHRKKSE